MLIRNSDAVTLFKAGDQLHNAERIKTTIAQQFIVQANIPTQYGCKLIKQFFLQL